VCWTAKARNAGRSRIAIEIFSMKASRRTPQDAGMVFEHAKSVRHVAMLQFGHAATKTPRK
jgi:hypothetical protein